MPQVLFVLWGRGGGSVWSLQRVEVWGVGFEIDSVWLLSLGLVTGHCWRMSGKL